MLNFKRMRFPIDVILVCSQERGVSVGHSSINRWAIRFLQIIAKMARKHKPPVSGSRRMDETRIKVKGVWNTSIAPFRFLCAQLNPYSQQLHRKIRQASADKAARFASSEALVH